MPCHCSDAVCLFQQRLSRPGSMMRNSDDYYRLHASELTEQLYLAAARSVTSTVLRDLGITSIVNATVELPTVAYQKQETIQIAVEDRVASKLYVYFDLVADKIQPVSYTHLTLPTNREV